MYNNFENEKCKDRNIKGRLKPAIGFEKVQKSKNRRDEQNTLLLNAFPYPPLL